MTGGTHGGKGQNKVSSRLEPIEAAMRYELRVVTFFNAYCSNQYGKWVPCRKINPQVTHLIAYADCGKAFTQQDGLITGIRANRFL